MITFNNNTKDTQIIDMRDTMYPTYALMVNQSHIVRYDDIGWSTLMGYSYNGATICINTETYLIRPKQYFSFAVKNKDVEIVSNGPTFCVFRLGFQGHSLVGTLDSSKAGKLSYIDGCSDSLLVYPPRLGDATLNYLHFPKNILQSYHTHPSIRVGCVIQGSGISDTTEPLPLTEGTFFCLEEHELHRFRTENSEMKIIAYHPDGDWGPTDENHTMLNRTYIKR